MKGGAKVVVEKHRHEGVFVARGKEDALVTKNMVVGESVYGEKRISVDVRATLPPNDPSFGKNSRTFANTHIQTHRCTARLQTKGSGIRRRVVTQRHSPVPSPPTSLSQ